MKLTLPKEEKKYLQMKIKNLMPFFWKYSRVPTQYILGCVEFLTLAPLF